MYLQKESIDNICIYRYLIPVCVRVYVEDVSHDHTDQSLLPHYLAISLLYILCYAYVYAFSRLCVCV